ncbi:hypothetical protein BCR15_13545 [Tessaracoccus lapidicaptus]|uniref:Uncharacterized protein n=1 Tax=Tessaracoccus lapidicaptus TaxID=1427523 RepID=A0A1C0AQY3_9ACTN|nr:MULTISPECIES: hypothetical protein [Tessaracoccus]AQX14882.1 hypothetical protein BKM78_02245 [Tessaracoccus sp. T2.5-30]OCL36726.1 hypothetical protein BCR15_13545 [Tessaracoccus lapidicaptus]VEP39018.1 hypothetical protein TLA_TLA_00456 [Tessaracoccus lapidicaptus]
MGLDYRYLLFVERDAEMDALGRLAGISPGRPGETSVEVPAPGDIPYRAEALPFRATAGTPSHLWWDDPTPEWNFAIVLAFEPDDAIRWYQRDDPRLDAHGRHEIGYIYLTLHRHMGDWAAGGSDDLVLFEFGTTGSKMSAMFSESESVRRVMVGLLEGCRGVCGIFDWEDHATLFWWRGRELDVELPEADLDLAEVARFVPPEASL